MLLGLVSSVAGFVKVRNLSDKPVIDNLAFRLHYRVTSALFFLCCILVTANNLIGEPIQCVYNNENLKNVINTFCWITSTHTISYGQQAMEIDHIAGLGPDHKGQTKTIHSYYQWVPFVLFFLGILFYAPHWIWKHFEQGKVKMITDGMRGTAATISDEKNTRLTRLVNYLYDSRNLHGLYSFGYIFCEVLNFVTVMGTIFFLDKFVGGAFLKYGPKVVTFSQMDQEFRSDPMIEAFPRMTKCAFKKYGPSGTVETHDALCVLALNILNEKIFVFLWFWLVILAVISGMALVYSAAVALSPSIRASILRRRFRFGTPQGLECLIRRTAVGDFLLLHLLGQNMPMRIFVELLDELSRRLQVNPNSHYSAPIYPNIEEYTKEIEKLLDPRKPQA